MTQNPGGNPSDATIVTPIDAALSDLAMAAVARLATEMHTARTSKERIAAANSILDRTGYGRSTRAQSDVADDSIRRALEAARASAPEPKAIERGVAEQ